MNIIVTISLEINIAHGEPRRLFSQIAIAQRRSLQILRVGLHLGHLILQLRQLLLEVLIDSQHFFLAFGCFGHQLLDKSGPRDTGGFWNILNFLLEFGKKL